MYNTAISLVGIHLDATYKGIPYTAPCLRSPDVILFAIAQLLQRQLPRCRRQIVHQLRAVSGAPVGQKESVGGRGGRLVRRAPNEHHGGVDAMWDYLGRTPRDANVDEDALSNLSDDVTISGLRGHGDVGVGVRTDLVASGAHRSENSAF